jgi:hypothetical protein
MPIGCLVDGVERRNARFEISRTKKVGAASAYSEFRRSRPG